MRRLSLALISAVAVAGCDASDPLGLYPDPAIEVAAPLEFTGSVVDAAGLLTEAEESHSSALLHGIEETTLAQVVVVTTPSLDGQEIAEYSLALGRGWAIGDDDRNDGLLVVVAPHERVARIEVGYGLESRVDDPFAKEVIDEMTPHFAGQRYYRGIQVGLERLEARLREFTQRDAA